MEKKKDCIKDIYVWLDGGRQKACSVKCNSKDIEKILNILEGEFNRMFTYSESYKLYYGEGSIEKAIKQSFVKVKRIIKKAQKEEENKQREIES